MKQRPEETRSKLVRVLSNWMDAQDALKFSHNNVSQHM